MQGGMPSLVVSSPHLRLSLLYFVIVDVMASTTSPPLDNAKAASQLEIIRVLPTLYGNGLSTCFPCPLELFVDIIHINHLRSREKYTVTSTQDIRGAYLIILGQINTFSPEAWAAQVASDQNGGCGPPACSRKASDHTKSHESSFAGWLSLAYAYQSAVAIYCTSSLSSLEDRSLRSQDRVETDGITSTKTPYREALYLHLRKIQLLPPGQNAQLWKLLIWPLVIAGIEAPPGDEISKSFVREQLAWLSASLGTSSPLVAKRLLEKVWQSGESWLCGDRRRWDVIFDHPYVFVI